MTRRSTNTLFRHPDSPTGEEGSSLDFQIRKNDKRKSFTLIELLVVLALVAILSVVVVMTLNPAELIKQARDSNRLSDLSTINTALNLFSTDVTSGFMGTSTVVYVSIPDNASSTCGSLGLPALPSGYTYNCATTANLRNTNGTGWIPVNFGRISSNSPISQLPIDPTNTTSSGNYYTYITGGSWMLSAIPESTKQKAELSARPQVTSYPGVIGMGNNLNLSPLFNPAGLVGYWKFDEGSGTVAKDSSGQGNDGSSINGPAWIRGKAGDAMRFDGIDDSVSAPDAPNLNFGTTNFSVSFWIKKDIAVGQHGIISKNTSTVLPGWIFYQSNSDVLVFLISDGSGTYNAATAGAINDQLWHHVIGIADRSSSILKIYLDGVQKNIVGITITGSVSGAYVLNMASRWGQLDGSLDDIRIYNRAISAAEILALYNATK